MFLRERLNEDLQQIIDGQTEPWGIKVTTVEIKDVGIPSTMQRAIVRQAEAEREQRAEIIHAEGEHQASAKLSQAAAILSQTPAAMQLRYLQTLSELGGERGSDRVPVARSSSGRCWRRPGARRPATTTRPRWPRTAR